MGRSQLKYRKRGGGSAGGRGRGSAASHSAPQRRRHGGDSHTRNLPSNTEKWGQAFGGKDALGSTSSRAGFEETERLLDESDWVAGPRFLSQEDEGPLAALEVGSVVAPGGDFLTLDLDVLSACLLRIPPHQRLGLPAAFCEELQSDLAEDTALPQPSTGGDDSVGRPRTEDGTGRHQHASEQTTQARLNTSEENRNAPSAIASLQAGTPAHHEDVNDDDDDNKTDDNGTGGADPKPVLPAPEKTEMPPAAGERTQQEAEVRPQTARQAADPGGDDGVLDALLGLTVSQREPVTAGRTATATDFVDSGGDNGGDAIGRTPEDGLAGGGAGGPVVGGGADELEDWLDDMLAED